MNKLDQTKTEIIGRLRSLSRPIKYCWLTIMIGLAIFYAYSKKSEIAQAVDNITVFAIILSAAFLILTKILISEMILITLTRNNQHSSFGHVFYMYNTTQIAKYIPGAIWHFVGRAVFYRELGMNSANVTKAILTENVWLISGAALTSMMALLIQIGITPTGAWRELLEPLSRFTEPNGKWLQIFTAIAIVSLIIAVFAWRITRKTALKIFLTTWPDRNAAILMVAIQVTLSISFYMILRTLEPDVPFLFVLSAYAGATGLGFIALFAPSGLGVKEGALMVFLMPYMSAEAAFTAASIHRLIYVFVDLLLGALAANFSSRRPTTGS